MVAAGIEAFVPSEELITNEVPLAVVDKFVVTFSITVTAPVLPLTLVTESVGVASSVKSAIVPAVPPLCIYVLFSSVLTTTSPS